LRFWRGEVLLLGRRVTRAIASVVLVSLFTFCGVFAAEVEAAQTESSPVTESQDEEKTEDPWSRFASDIGPSFGSVFTWDNALPAAAMGAATGASSLADEEVQHYFGQAKRFGAASEVVSHAAFLTGAFGGVIAAGLFSDNPRLRVASYDLAQGFLVNNAVTFAIKVAVRRERPDGGNFAFPSGHASNVFTAATILDHHYGAKIGIPLYVFATFVSVSRIDLNSHWLSDTVAGAGIGILVGRSIVRRHKPSKVEWLPLISKDVVGLQVVVRP